MILSIIDQLIIFLNKFCGQITANKEDHMAASWPAVQNTNIYAYVILYLLLPEH